MSSTRGLANGGIQVRFDLARVNIRAIRARAILYHFDLDLPAGAETYLDYRRGFLPRTKLGSPTSAFPAVSKARPSGEINLLFPVLVVVILLGSHLEKHAC